MPNKSAIKPADDNALTDLPAIDLLNKMMRPIGAQATIRWKDVPDEVKDVYISFGEVDINDDDDEPKDTFGVDDQAIFYYCNPEDLDEPFDEFEVLGYQCVYSDAAYQELEVDAADDQDDEDDDKSPSF